MACVILHIIRYENEHLTQAECESKCVDLACDCFDFRDHSGSGGGGGLPTGVTGFGPAGIFTKDLANVAVISSFSNFMAASAGVASDKKGVVGLQKSFCFYMFMFDFDFSFVFVFCPSPLLSAAQATSFILFCWRAHSTFRILILMIILATKSIL